MIWERKYNHPKRTIERGFNRVPHFHIYYPAMGVTPPALGSVGALDPFRFSRAL